MTSFLRTLILQITSLILRLLGLTLFSIGLPISILPSSIFNLIGILLTRFGVGLISVGKQILFPSAENLLKRDSRSLILYLRAFRNAGADAAKIPIPFYLFPVITMTADEERLAQVMNQVGPFVAIGEPREKGAGDLGAARFYVTDDKWQGKVIELIEQAQLVVLRIDPAYERWGLWSSNKTPYSDLQLDVLRVDDIPEGVWWEVGQVGRRMRPERILFYLPFKGKISYREGIYETVRWSVEKHLGRKLPEHIGKAKFIGFKPEGNPYLLGNNSFSLFGFINTYAQTLRPVFTQLRIKSPKTTFDYFRVVELLFGLLTTSLFFLAILFTLLFLIRGL
jgi:hypothetical protein